MTKIKLKSLEKREKKSFKFIKKNRRKHSNVFCCINSPLDEE